MIEQGVRRLRELAHADPVVTLLALLQAEALSASANPSWSEGVPHMDAARISEGHALLEGLTLQVDGRACIRLLDRLGEVAGAAGVQGGALALAVRALEPHLSGILAAAITQDGDGMAAVAAEANVAVGQASVIGQLIAFPILLACGAAAQTVLPESEVHSGPCPVCNGWPLLAELRGLERKRWRRCGRCASAWQPIGPGCAFCGNEDHHKLGYLAPEQQREASQAAFCEACRGYLKTFTTLRALDAGELLARDLTTLELDVAAMERGRTRPGPRRLDVFVQVAQPDATGTRVG